MFTSKIRFLLEWDFNLKKKLKKYSKDETVFVIVDVCVFCNCLAKKIIIK